MLWRKPNVLLAGVLLGAMTLAFAQVPSVYAAGDDAENKKGPCSTNPFKFSQVEQACKAGGRTKASDFMEDTVKKAKSKGIKLNDATIKCKSCHVNLKAYKLLDNAVDDLRSILDDLKPPKP